MIQCFTMALLACSLVACVSKPPKLSNHSQEQVLKGKLLDKLSLKAQKRVYVYHPSYGEVALPNDDYDKTSRECTQNIYRQGVWIGGVLETSPAMIKPYREAYDNWKVQAFSKLIASQIHPESSSVQPPQLPDFYLSAQWLSDDIAACIHQAGWIQSRIEWESLPEYQNRAEVLDRKDFSVSSLLEKVAKQLLAFKY